MVMLRDEPAIHHIHVNPIGPGGIDSLTLFTQTAKVSRQN